MTSPLTPTRPPPPSRPRFNSRDIPRTYSGLYGDGNDLLPFELTRNPNTEWLVSNQYPNSGHSRGMVLLLLYLTVIFMVHMILLTLFGNWNLTWTMTHTLHFMVTMTYLHWIKGSPNVFEQGEMNAMTTWEQLESTQNSARPKLVLCLVPTFLCYLACFVERVPTSMLQHHPSNSTTIRILWNISLWCICLLSKLPCMNGVRIFGINRTTGIDDGKYVN
jgi:ORMDL family